MEKNQERLFDNASKTYKEQVDASLTIKGISSHFFLKGKIDFLLSKVKVPVSGSISVLDVGCGVGESHQFFRKSIKKMKLTGVDISKESINLAQKKNKDNTYVHYDGHHLPFTDDSFDCVMISCVMHHIEPSMWQNMVNEMMRVLKAGGMLFVFEHNPLNPLTRLAVYKCPFDEDAVLLRSGTIEKLISHTNSGHKIKTDYLFFTPFSGQFFRKLDRCLSFVPMGAQYCTYVTKK